MHAIHHIAQRLAHQRIQCRFAAADKRLQNSHIAARCQFARRAIGKANERQAITTNAVGTVQLHTVESGDQILAGPLYFGAGGSHQIAGLVAKLWVCIPAKVWKPCPEFS